MNRMSLTLFAAASLAGMAVSSQAALSYAWTTDAPAGGFVLTPGANQTVHLYLKESGATASSGIVHEDGLLGVGFSVTGTLPGQITGFAPNTTDFPMVAVSSFTSTIALLSGQISFSALTGPVPDSNGLIQLGTITVSSLGPNVTTFTVGDFGPGTQTGTVSVGALNSMDSTISAGAFTVAVPEPSSALLCGGLLGVLALRRRSQGSAPADGRPLGD